MDEAQIKVMMEKIKAAYWNRQLVDADLIATVRSPEVMAELVKWLGSDDYVTRSNAGFALAELVGEIAKPELIKALSSERWQARAASADRIWHYKDPSLVQYLIP